MLALVLLACTPSTAVIGLPPQGTSDTPTKVPPGTDTTVITGTETDTDTDTDADTDTDTDTDPTDEEELAQYEAFYAFDSLHEVRFTLSDEAIDAMNEDVRDAQRGRDLVMEWQHGDVEIDGLKFSDVAVRVKGSSTLQNFDGKPSLKIKLNEYVSGQTWAGMERLTLNNDVEDSSQAKQVMVYHLNRRGGRRAARASHAVVYVNDELYGLYTNLEAMDDRWIARHYDDPSGDLWEANDYAEFSRSGLDNWELVSGKGDSDAIIAVGTELRDSGDDLLDRLDTLVDMDDFLHFWAWRIMVGDLDGYPMNSNDVYIYRDPADNRFDFMPWGVDESWYSDAPAYWSYASGSLGSGCVSNSACAAAYKDALGEVVDTYDALDALTDLDLMYAATDAALEEDPRRPYNLSQAQEARENLRQSMTTFPDRIRTAAGL